MNQEQLHEWLQQVSEAAERAANKIAAIFTELGEALSEIDWPFTIEGDEDGRNETD